MHNHEVINKSPECPACYPNGYMAETLPNGDLGGSLNVSKSQFNDGDAVWFEDKVWIVYTPANSINQFMYCWTPYITLKRRVENKDEAVILAKNGKKLEHAICLKIEEKLATRLKAARRDVLCALRISEAMTKVMQDRARIHQAEEKAVKSEPWYENEDPGKVAKGAAWRTVIVIICIVLFLGLISLGIWVFRVATSGVQGQGDAIIQKNAGTNQIVQQGMFENLNQEFVSSKVKLVQAYVDKVANPGNQVYATNYTGILNYCISTAAQYNAASKSYISQDFKDVNLPYKLDPTECGNSK